MSMTRRRLLDNTFKKTVNGNPAIATDSLARMYPGITMQGWTEQDGTPTPEAPVPIVSAGTWDETAQKWEYEITITNTQADPDKNQTVTLTADRPLTKWDRLEKRNGQRGWVYKSNTSVFDGSDDEGWILDDFLFDKVLPDAIPGQNTYGYCDKFVFGDPYEIDKIGINVNKILWARVNWVSADVEAWNDYLSQNPITVTYPTNTETFVPLTAAEQAAMNALYTYRPTTVLSNQQCCQMALTYKTRKSMEVTA